MPAWLYISCVLTLLLATRGAVAGQELPLAENGSSRFSIIYANQAPDSVREAAIELQYYVERVTTAKLPVLSEGDGANGPYVSLGATMAARRAGLSVETLPPEGFRIVADGENIFILGRDEGRTSQGGTSLGTTFGVFAFIEDYLSVRWLVPGLLGEDVPRKSTVAVPRTDRVVAPTFASRTLAYIQGDKIEVKRWMRHQRLGGSMALDYSHSWHTVVRPEMFTSHPQWFAQIGGRRVAPNSTRYKLETTNPSVVRHFATQAIAAFDRDPTRYMFSIAPTDSANWSESGKAKRYYDKAPDGQLSLSPLVLKFYNDVARSVAVDRPSRMLGGLIYADYLYPPSDGMPPIADNLFLVVAPDFDYGYQLYRETTRESWQAVVSAWASATRSIGYFDLPNTIYGDVLTPPAPAILNFIFPRLAALHVKSALFFGGSGWGQAAVKNYVLSRLMWNASQDAHSIVHEFCERAYGKDAGAIVEEIYRDLDRRLEVFYNRDRSITHTVTPAYVKEVMEARHAHVESLYQKAVASTKEASVEQRARLDLLGKHIVLARWQLRSLPSPPPLAASSFDRTDRELQEMLEYDDPGFGVAIAPDFGVAPSKKVFPPVVVSVAPPIRVQRSIRRLATWQALRVLLYPEGDGDVRITPIEVNTPNAVARYGVYDEDGTSLVVGTLRRGREVRFAALAGRIYYFEVLPTTARYELSIEGARYAFATNVDPKKRGFHFLGEATPVYFFVPKTARRFTVLVSSKAPSETCRVSLYNPRGNRVHSGSTVRVPVARLNVEPKSASEPWDGFWRLEVQKAPSGALRGVDVKLDESLPQWFIIDPRRPLRIEGRPKPKPLPLVR